MQILRLLKRSYSVHILVTFNCNNTLKSKQSVMQGSNICFDIRQQYPIIGKCYSNMFKQIYLASNRNPENQPKQELMYIYLFRGELSLFSTPFQNIIEVTKSNYQETEWFTVDYLRKVKMHLNNIYGDEKDFIMKKIFGKKLNKEDEEFYSRHVGSQQMKQQEYNANTFNYLTNKYKIEKKDLDFNAKINAFRELQSRIVQSLLLTSGSDRLQRLLFRSRQLRSSYFSLTPIPNSSWKKDGLGDPLVISKVFQQCSFDQNNTKLQRQRFGKKKIKMVLNLEQFRNLRVPKQDGNYLAKFAKQICEQLLEYQFLTGKQYERLSKLSIFYSEFNDRFFLSIKPILDEAIGYPNGYEERQNILQYFNEQNACRDCSLQKKVLGNGGKVLLLLHYLQSQHYEFRVDPENLNDPAEWLKGLYGQGEQSVNKIQEELEKVNKIKAKFNFKKDSSLCRHALEERIPVCKLVLLQYFEMDNQSKLGFRRKPHNKFPPTVLDVVNSLKLKSKITNLSADRFQGIIYLRWRVMNKLLDINKTSRKVVEKISELFNPKQFKLINRSKLDEIKKQIQVAGVFLKTVFWVSSLQLKSILQEEDYVLAKDIQLDGILHQFLQDSQNSQQKLGEFIGKKGERFNELAQYATVLIRKLRYITSQGFRQGERDEDTAIVYSLIIKKLLLNYQKSLYSKINSQEHEELSKKFKKNFFRYLVKITKGLISFVLCINTNNFFWSEYFIYRKLKKFIESTQENPGEFDHFNQQILKERKDFQENRGYKDSLVWGDIWPQHSYLLGLDILDI